MTIREKIRDLLKISDTRMDDWIDTIHSEVGSIKESEIRSRRLEEIKDMMHTFFLAEMGNAYREFPITSDNLRELVRKLFIEIGYAKDGR